MSSFRVFTRGSSPILGRVLRLSGCAVHRNCHRSLRRRTWQRTIARRYSSAKLSRELRANGIAVVDSPVDATAVLSILDDETGQRVLSVSARNIPREYEVFYRVSFSLQHGQQTLLEPREQAVARDYTYDETLVLGKAREEEQIRNAITDDLVRLVMFQLAAL